MGSTGESARESHAYTPGDRAVLADSAVGCLGLTICYDMRFPHLYRALAKAGAQVMTVPAAFTRTTGKAHWHVLLRARAIETGCYVFAPAQCGEHVAQLDLVIRCHRTRLPFRSALRYAAPRRWRREAMR